MLNSKWVLKSSMVMVLLLILFLITGSGLAFDPVEEFEPVDFGGATITYMCWYNPFGAFEEGGDYAGRLEEAKDRFNIGEIEFLDIPWGEQLRETAMSRLMAGDATHDIWFLPNPEIWPLAAQGAFYPIGEIIPEEYYQAMPHYIEQMFDELMIEGQRFAFGLGNDHLDNIHFMIWNKDLFEREGLTPLDELYLADEWTWEAMEEIAIQATRDTTGDGEIDQYGIGDISAPHMVLANDGEIVRRDEAGRFVFSMAESEATLYALEKLYEWGSVLNIQSGTWDLNEFIDGTRAMARVEMWQLWDLPDQMEEDYGIVPLPRGPHADDYRYPALAMDTVFLPATAQDPEGLVALHNFLYPREEHVLAREEQMMELAPDRTSYEVFARAMNEFSADSAFLLEGVIGFFWDGSRPFGEAFGSVIWGGENPASAMQAATPAIQAEIDEFFGQ